MRRIVFCFRTICVILAKASKGVFEMPDSGPHPDPRLRQPLIALTQQANRRSAVTTMRDMIALFAKSLRGSLERRVTALAGFSDAARFHADETGSWVTASALADDGLAAPRVFDQGFDACDLGMWLTLAEQAGLETIPARPVLALTEDEHARLTALSSKDLEQFLGGLAVHGARDVDAAIALIDAGQAAAADPLGAGGETDLAKLVERCAAAMDDVPEGWMVRFARCGSSNLKSLSGCGLAGPEAPETAFGPDLAVGPGWVRRGNRRFVDVGDDRIVKASAQGPVGPRIFYARPWVRPARFVEADDPHRAGSPFVGKGFWPIELRAFVQGGKVIGVSNYYPQIGMEISPDNARLMLEARDKAQALADAARDLKLWPRFMDIEFARKMKPEVAPVGLLDSLERDFGRDDVAFTCDFLEIADEAGERRLVLLEAGPAASPMGGGHPCCFAGLGGPPKLGAPMKVEGVAFSRLPYVNMMEPKTWSAPTPEEMDGHILSWDEVEALALEDLDATHDESLTT